MLEKISDRIYCLPYSTMTDRPNLYYIRGNAKSLAVDAGNSPAHVELFYSELEKAGLKKPDMTVITHWHWDHTFGICALDCPVISTDMTAGELEYVSTWEWTPKKMKERELNCIDIPFCNENIVKEYSDLSSIKVKVPDTVITERTKIDLGGITCILDPHDSTHSRDSLFIHIPEERVLIIGDADCGDFYDLDGRYDRFTLMQMKDYLMSFDVDKYLLGHCEPQTKEEERESLEYAESLISFSE